MKPDPQRTGHVKRVARFQRRHTLGAAAFAFVEELDLSCRFVDLVDAHRATHPDFGAVRSRAQQMKKLTGIGGQGFFRRLQHHQFVFVIDPVVGDDNGDVFADRLVRVRIGIAGSNSGIGVFFVGCQIGHGCGLLLR